MKTDLDERARLAALIAKRRAAHNKLPEQLRQDAIAYTRRRVAKRTPRITIARELGVSAMTVTRWLALAAQRPRSKAAAGRAAKLRRVRVVDAPAASRGVIVVTTASGVRVEGLAAGDVITFLRALG
jgi:hypothetical protein